MFGFLPCLDNLDAVFGANAHLKREKSPNAKYVRTLFGGGRWIRTTEVTDNRFTVCPLWPLGNSPIQIMKF